ncbi:hypothetical protein MTR_7g052025 [Medicago truncatula]|uniref:Uncharacterized protein n=1 Tax=Medicago truncatula TaxID=3880 RepID=A0A072U9N5_MEDTR|nr:hypothetical protein MTR_7g052025 [Medicago truncatula]
MSLLNLKGVDSIPTISEMITLMGRNFERILDGLSLRAKERDLEPIGHKNMKIERQNMSPTSQKLGTARASLGTAVPPSRVSFAAFA